jgi:predicted alpha/beta hydrolase family esterase
VDDWKKNLQEDLGEGCAVLPIAMPNKLNAKYEEWQIWFERHIPFFEDDVVLIGHSLGGVFLAKYLAENDLPKRVAKTFLVAAPYETESEEYHLDTFVLPESRWRFAGQGGEILLFHSKDDAVVPYPDAERYARALPKAELVALNNLGHINQEHFPELVNRIVAE